RWPEELAAWPEALVSLGNFPFYIAALLPDSKLLLLLFARSGNCGLSCSTCSTWQYPGWLPLCLSGCSEPGLWSSTQVTRSPPSQGRLTCAAELVWPPPGSLRNLG